MEFEKVGEKTKFEFQSWEEWGSMKMGMIELYNQYL